MVRIDLTQPEAVILRDVLENYVSDLRMEIADTDSMDLREELKGREALLKHLIGRLEPKI
jgi:predicted transcriptional regulator